MSGAKWKPLDVIAQDVQSGKVTAKELVEASFGYIEQAKEYKAIISVCRERALDRAKEIDARQQQGERLGRLAGVPFIAKDNFLTLGGATTAASNILNNFNAPYQATVIDRLEAEGAICVAKANLDAFAHGSSTENSDWFTTKNPHDKSRVPGGSSGGSAAAVALELAPFALGTDTGGSIRQPAAFCGIVGLKPSYGLLSRNGVIAMASSTDVIGPLARSVADAALVVDVAAGKDEWDGTTIDRAAEPYTKLEEFSLSGKKVALISEYFPESLPTEIKDATKQAIEKMTALGATIEEISLPSLPLSLACYYVIGPAEISSNLARYDGQRYGHVSSEAESLEEAYTKSRSEGFGSEAKRRIMIGTYVLSSGFYDAYYRRAQQVRTKLINEFNQAFEEYDLLIGPTAPTTAFKIGENTKDPMQMYLSDVMTVAANLTGVPAISLPSGTAEDKLPIGLQLIAPQNHDRKLLGYAKEIEEALK